jgi:putative DNA primase/helicase
MTGDPTLTAGDLELFRRIGVGSELLASAQVRRVTDAEARREYGITTNGDMRGVVFPYLDPLTGRRATARLRRDYPEGSDGKPENKYICPLGDNRHLYFVPGARDLLSDPTVPVVFVEAEKSALALTALAIRRGWPLLAVGTGGCWGWRGKTGIEPGPNGDRQEVRGPLPDLARIQLHGRQTLIAFDSNTQTNPKVQLAQSAFAKELANRKAKVFILDIPDTEGVNGPDDLIAVSGDGAMIGLLTNPRAFESVSGGSAAIMRRASEIEPQALRWLWPNRIALGKLTLFVGDPGEGKTLVAVDLAARITAGSDWPDGGHAEKGSVIIMSAEDDPADTLVPRLIAAGAELQRVHFLDAAQGVSADGKPRKRAVTLADLATIEDALTRVSDASLVIVDPISAYLSGTDSHNNAEIRTLLSPLADLAARRSTSIIAITHLAKSPGKAIYRAIGSIGFIGAARAAWLFAKQAGEPERRLMLPVKNNLAANNGGLAYRLESASITLNSGEQAPSVKVNWESGTVNLSADEILATESPDERGARAEAVEWLKQILADGPLPVTEVEREAKAAGITEATLRRARTLLAVKPRKRGFDEGWELALPQTERAPETAEGAHSPQR